MAKKPLLKFSRFPVWVSTHPDLKSKIIVDRNALTIEEARALRRALADAIWNARRLNAAVRNQKKEVKS